MADKLRQLARDHAHEILIRLMPYGVELCRRHEPVIIGLIGWDDVETVDLTEVVVGAISQHGLGLGFEHDPRHAGTRPGSYQKHQGMDWYCGVCHTKLVHQGEHTPSCKPSRVSLTIRIDTKEFVKAVRAMSDQLAERITTIAFLDATGAPVVAMGAVRSCRICGCTEDDCSGCARATGVPCHWVEADLCSACRDQGLPELIAAADAHEAGECGCVISIDHENGHCTACGGVLPA